MVGEGVKDGVPVAGKPLALVILALSVALVVEYVPERGAEVPV